ncbi:hypothetical protein [Desulfosporosinus sp.]|uniref:hypothetical protein n=1 Tax=Desulfosporosinus sp. TaxID=157907 RepID=UPI000E8E8472|nr:hypothetical protein [Desulfosporosinus sp.]MBC2723057.1 hypothetical protein [Desulfosporosinus sp.]MBC2728992.1 hypothetical protein [Desulfosporosinus sp.]HBV86141.1 hypothetical protein [Desulfosporosinus sp.]
MERYEIIIKGHIDQRREDWFAGLEITLLSGGESRLAGEVADQAALHGILNRIRDMGLQLSSVKRQD